MRHGHLMANPAYEMDDNAYSLRQDAGGGLGESHEGVDKRGVICISCNFWLNRATPNMLRHEKDLKL